MFSAWVNKNRKQSINSEQRNIEHYLLKGFINKQIEENEEEIYFGCGCFWGAEKCFWKLPGVKTTAVGYAGGKNKNPSYRQVCSGNTNHAEVVRVIWDRREIDISDLLKMFWECHNPTQGNRQGNDIGSQYRSTIFIINNNHSEIILNSKNKYQELLSQNGFSEITTEVESNVPFYFAEDYHQQYLAKPGNRQYCSAMPTNISLGDFKGCNYKLSPNIWSNFNWEETHCVLRSSNTPITNS